LAKKELNLYFSSRAELSIASISIYIQQQGYPESAFQFANALYDFADSLLLFPAKYPLCRHSYLIKSNLRCAVFMENYIFIYQLLSDKVFVVNVVHASRLN
jgi:plasmid stabilization system protein ParE